MHFTDSLWDIFKWHVKTVITKQADTEEILPFLAQR